MISSSDSDVFLYLCSSSQGMGYNTEQEQTLNQLLVEMDGKENFNISVPLLFSPSVSSQANEQTHNKNYNKGTI